MMMGQMGADEMEINLNGVLVDMGLALRTTFYGVVLANLFFIGLVVVLRDLGVNYILLIILLLAIGLSMIPIWLKKRRG